MSQPFIYVLLSLLVLGLLSCSSKKELETVDSLDLNSYSGGWYEIAKLPNRFEKNLKCITATYTVQEDGKIEVFNRGYNTKTLKWEEITGKAKVANASKPGEIKVSFFGPFYGDYYVIDLAEDYSTALVGSPSRKYLWILSRKQDVDTSIVKRLLSKAQELSFDTSKVEMTVHDCEDLSIEL